MIGELRSPACAEADELDVAGARDGEQGARLVAHRQACPRCQARAARLSAVTQAVLGLDAGLDDVARARIAAGLEARLRAPAPQAARPVRWLALPLAAAAGFLVAALLSRAPAEAPVVSPVVPALLRPYPGEGPAPGKGLVGDSFDRLEVPAGMRMRATLGAHVRVTLLGPAQVQLTPAPEGTIALRLAAGLLLGDYDHRAGGRLLIDSPGAVTEVVGTRFAVEARAEGSRVAVSEGRVTVRPAGQQPITVGAGQRWSSGQDGVRPIDAATTTLLEEHGGRTPALAPEPAVVSPPRPRSPVARVARDETPRTPEPPPSELPPAPVAPAPAPPAPVAPAPAAPPPASIAPPAITAAGLYGQAEAAMARRDQGESRRRLQELIERFPADPLSAPARYELARQALRNGDRAAAVRHLDALLAAGREPALAESAAFLRCRVFAESDDGSSARRCFERFRGTYAHSARDPEALATLVQLAWRADACAEARLLADEYRRRYPTGPFAATAARIEAACAP